MKLRTRIPIFLGLILLIMLGVMYFTIFNYIVDETKNIEVNMMSNNIERVLGAIDREESSLQTSAGDYGAWNDTYDFAENKNQKYIDENFGSSSFANLHVNLVAVFDQQNNLIYSRRYDWENNKDLEISPNFFNEVKKRTDLFNFNDAHDKHADFIKFDGSLMFVSTHPIVNSEYEGPFHGTLLMARNFDNGYMGRLSLLTQLDLSMNLDVSEHTLSKLFALDKTLNPGAQRAVHFLSDELMEGVFTLKDRGGSPQAVIKISGPRTFNQLVMKSVWNMVLIFIIFVIVIVLAIFSLINIFILKRIYQLAGGVVNYESNPSILLGATRVGRDEITNLAQTVRNGLVELDASRKKIKDHASKIDIERKKLDAILYGIAEGVFVVDSKGKILLVNHTAKRISGYKYEELLNKIFHKKLKFFDKNDHLIDIDFLKQVFTDEVVKETQYDVVFMPKKREPIHVSLSASPIKKNGQVIASVVVFRDMTREYEVDKMKSEFVSIASHQMRTPLTGIKWMMTLLLQEKAGKLNKVQMGYLKSINVSNERMIQLVNDLLNISRIESATAKRLVITKCNLKDLIDEVINEQSGVAHEFDVKVVAEFDKKISNLGVYADHDKIYQAFMNLTNNALKYSKRGGVVHIGFGVKDGFAKVYVKDEGIGIPKEQQTRIFEKFFRADNAVQSVTTGTGLGLYYVKMVIEAHGGTIWFDSIPNKGTTFYFTVPIGSEEASKGV